MVEEAMDPEVARLALEAALRIHEKQVDLANVYIGGSILAATLLMLAALGWLAYAKRHGCTGQPLRRRRLVRGALASLAVALLLGAVHYAFLHEVAHSARAVRKIVTAAGYHASKLYVPETKPAGLCWFLLFEWVVFIGLAALVLRTDRLGPRPDDAEPPPAEDEQ